MNASPSPAVRPLLALLALFSGIALLLHIVARVSLRATLATAVSVTGIGLAGIVWRASAPERRLIGRSVLIGAVSGLIATMAYDLSKAPRSSCCFG